jgi:DeoR/GlpR family transcriptional regulator of sugar metabolism
MIDIERMYKYMDLLEGKRFTTASEFMTAMEISHATLKRDITVLREIDSMSQLSTTVMLAHTSLIKATTESDYQEFGLVQKKLRTCVSYVINYCVIQTQNCKMHINHWIPNLTV